MLCQDISRSSTLKNVNEWQRRKSKMRSVSIMLFMSAERNNENSPSEDSSLLEFYKETYARQERSHEIIWKAENYFTFLVSGLIAVALSLLSINAYATFSVLALAIILSVLGNYTLKRESHYFNENRYRRLQIEKLLGYFKKFPTLYFSDDLKNLELSAKEYFEKYDNREEGARYAFRLVYLIEAAISLLVWAAVLIVSILPSLLEEPANLNYRVIVIVLNIVPLMLLGSVVCFWYKWEIRTIWRTLNKWFDP